MQIGDFKQSSIEYKGFKFEGCSPALAIHCQSSYSSKELIFKGSCCFWAALHCHQSNTPVLTATLKVMDRKRELLALHLPLPVIPRQLCPAQSRKTGGLSYHFIQPQDGFCGMTPWGFIWDKPRTKRLLCGLPDNLKGYLPLITKDLPCPGIRQQRETVLSFQDLLISLLLALVRLMSHTSRRRKLCRHLGGLYLHQVLFSPCVEQPSGVRCLSGQL